MVEQRESSFEENAGTDWLLVSKDADGSVQSVGPFSRDRAEALVQVYGQIYPNQTCWIEPLLKEVQALHLGRVSRSSRLAVRPLSNRGH